MRDYNKDDIKLILSATESIPDPIFIMDQDGKYISIIGGAEKSLYDDSKYLIGKKVGDIVSKKTADFFLSIINKAIVSQMMQVFEYETSSEEFESNPKDGPTGNQWFEGRVSPIRLKYKSKSCVLWSAINITKKKKWNMSVKL